MKTLRAPSFIDIVIVLKIIGCSKLYTDPVSLHMPLRNQQTHSIISLAQSTFRTSATAAAGYVTIFKMGIGTDDVFEFVFQWSLVVIDNEPLNAMRI